MKTAKQSIDLGYKGTKKRLNLRTALISLCMFAFVGTSAQTGTVTVKLRNASVKELFSAIEKQTSYRFSYRDAEIKGKGNVTISATNRELKQLLEGELSKLGLKYAVSGNKIIVTPVAAVASAQPKKVTGKVVDANGEPVIGATIKEQGTANGTITDFDGNFNLDVVSGAILEVSYVGYKSQQLRAVPGRLLAITLKEDAEVLDEVVVTALGIKREEKALGYAVQKIGGDVVTTVKAVDVGSSLTGKIAGLQVQNSTEFNTAPSLSLRGEEPLLVVDGVPYSNITLRDIASDDIESIDVLKGATASALYGARGGNGAVMVTTKRGKEEGLRVSVNSNTMFNAGYLRLPEVQTSYSTGMNGKYNAEDFVWGDKMDIGRTAVQWDPIQKEWREMPLISKGKDNFKNFLEFSFLTNNNISVSQKGKYGSVRTSLTHIYNKGQFPNNRLHKLTYTVSGDMKFKNFSFEGGLTYNKRFYPTNYGTGYGAGGYIYSMLVWTGTDLDIRDYKNYWLKENEEQNWPNKVWYDNPYFIANEIISSDDYDVVNGYLNASYDFTSWLKLSLRTGVDMYSEKSINRNSIGAYGGWNKKGYYSETYQNGFSINNDLIVSANKKIGDFVLDGLLGATLYYYYDNDFEGKTVNGLSIPGYYSLKASVDPASVSTSINKKQVNSVYAKLSASWKSALFLDITARNDWSSTLPRETRSYFYPSVAGSIIMSEFIKMPDWIDFWKLRASWTQTKSDLDVYEIQRNYDITTNVWDNMQGAAYPTKMRDPFILPSGTKSYEIGTALNFFANRLKFDFAYYNKLYYNLTTDASISDTSGFEYTLINTDEEHVRRGVELTVSGDIIKTKDWDWSATFNWSRDRYLYSKLDPIYSAKKDWVKVGERYNGLEYYDWERDYHGNIIHDNGYPVQSKFVSLAGYEDPDWIFGLNTVVRYKNFTLSVSVDGRVGGVAHSVMDQALWMTGAHKDSDTKWRYDEVVNGKTNYVGDGVKVVSGTVEYDSQGHIISDTRMFATNDRPVSYEGYMKQYHGAGNVWDAKHQHILDQTFVKLRELSLNYDLSQSLCEKLKLKGASIAFVGNNLFMWTKDFKFSDPDVASENLNSPSLRMLGVNIKINF